MDDVDSVQAQIARNMLHSGDWVTGRLDGVAYLEKAPGPYWTMAASFDVFGVHDWAARIPLRFPRCCCVGSWRDGQHGHFPRAGLYAGLVLATCVGLFLFTRIQIPDITLTLAIRSHLGLLRAWMRRKRGRASGRILAASLGCGCC